MSFGSLEEFLRQGTVEFIERNGRVTVECRVHIDGLEKIKPLLIELSRQISEKVRYGRWVAYRCTVCRGYSIEEGDSEEDACDVHVSAEKWSDHTEWPLLFDGQAEIASGNPP